MRWKDSGGTGRSSSTPSRWTSVSPRGGVQSGHFPTPTPTLRSTGWMSRPIPGRVRGPVHMGQVKSQGSPWSSHMVLVGTVTWPTTECQSATSSSSTQRSVSPCPLLLSCPPPQFQSPVPRSWSQSYSSPPKYAASQSSSVNNQSQFLKPVFSQLSATMVSGEGGNYPEECFSVSP